LHLSSEGYDPENFDNLIKRKYWEVLREKYEDDKDKEMLNNNRKRKRILTTALSAFKEEWKNGRSRKK